MIALSKHKAFVCLATALLAGLPALSPALADTAAMPPEEQEFLELYFPKEQLVETATRYPKPVTQVAENVTVITKDEIEAMNAGTVLEVLQRVPGLHITFYGRDVGSPGVIQIHGSQTHQVLVLLDGLRINLLSGGDPFLNWVPVGIISRIEIIRGPASSTWGSALGGVINIITKQPGNTSVPTGSITAAYGDGNSGLLNGEVTGKVKPTSYYLFAETRESDGIMNDRFFDRDSFYGKAEVAIPRDIKLGFTAGYSAPHFGTGPLRDLDLLADTTDRRLFTTATIDAPLTSELAATVSLGRTRKIFNWDNEWLGLSGQWPAGETYQNYSWDETTNEASSRLTWRHGLHTAALGAEYQRGQVNQFVRTGDSFRNVWLPYRDIPTKQWDHALDERWGVYVNDTIHWQRFTITPGLRYDSNSISDNFVSPSLGATWEVDQDTVLRGAIARGFSAPFLSLTTGLQVFGAIPNPELGPEKVWSYQLGAETTKLKYIYLKTTFFWHDVEDFWFPDWSIPQWVNGPDQWRYGGELEIETAAYHNFSLTANYSYVYINQPAQPGDDLQIANLICRYVDGRDLTAELVGNWLWRPRMDNENLQNDMFWDLAATKRLLSRGNIELAFFAKAHNLFNGNQYWDPDYFNPRRWFEAGIRLYF